MKFGGGENVEDMAGDTPIGVENVDEAGENAAAADVETDDIENIDGGFVESVDAEDEDDATEPEKDTL